jgi:hypothetical protein
MARIFSGKREVITVEGVRAVITVKGCLFARFGGVRKIYRCYRLAWLPIEPHRGGAIRAGVESFSACRTYHRSRVEIFS